MILSIDDDSIATYGGHLELHCFSRRYRKRVKVIQPGLAYIVSFEDESRYPKKETLQLEQEGNGPEETDDELLYVAYHNW
jgi:OTU domain-containing protein 3